MADASDGTDAGLKPALGNSLLKGQVRQFDLEFVLGLKDTGFHFLSGFFNHDGALLPGLIQSLGTTLTSDLIRARNGDAVLAIITGVEGPSYRPVGAMMAVFDDGLPWDEKLKLYRHRIDWVQGVPTPARAEGEAVELNLILKADFQGWLEKIVNSIIQL